MLYCPFGVVKGCLQIHDYSKRFLDQAVKSTGAKALIKLATLLWRRGDGHVYITVLEVVTNCKMFDFWSGYFSQKETHWRACLQYSVYLYLYTYGLSIILILHCLSIMALRIFICSLIFHLLQKFLSGKREIKFHLFFQWDPGSVLFFFKKDHFFTWTDLTSYVSYKYAL